MLEEEYERRRVLPRHLRPAPEPEPEFAYEIRDAVETDLPHIRGIYNYYVTNSTVTFDEDEMTLAEWQTKFAYLKKRGYPVLVAESPNGVVLGYALVSPWKDKSAYRFTVEDSIYLGPAATGKGLGNVLMKALLDASKQAGLKQVIAVIADKGADASIAMHAKFGFTENGRMGKVGFKFGRWLGVVTMQRSLK
jgi:phosphinothricin acetyltransferase